MAAKTPNPITVRTLQRVIFTVPQQVTTAAATPILLNNFKFTILVRSRLTEILYAIHKLQEKNQVREF